MHHHRPVSAQRGISLTGLIFILVILGAIGVLGMKIVPTVIEYRAITKAIVSAKESGSTVYGIRSSFNKHADTSYIDSITGSDLIIEKIENQYEVSFAYQKKIPLFGPASLVLDYEGTTIPANVRRLNK